MQFFLTWLFAIYFFASSAVLVFVNAIICLFVAPFDPLRRAVHGFSCYWGYHYFQINPFWKLTYRGLEQIDRHKKYVLVANHQSVADILVLYGLHRYYKWVSKAEVLKVPFIGWNMLLNQYVFLKRGDMKSIKEMMQICRDWLNKGASVMLFPEGTRSADGQLQSFRDGAFKLAIDCNVELVPIVINGTHEVFGKGAQQINFRKRMDINILPPVDPSQFDRSSGKMRAFVHKLMADELARMRGQTPADTESDHLSGRGAVI
jgi:1-acyl-sn-glycerol-3-phosphate acyltransferase